MSNNTETDPAHGRRYFGWREAERYSSLSRSTLRRLVAAGRLNVFRPTGRRALIDRLQLDEVILGGPAD